MYIPHTTPPGLPGLRAEGGHHVDDHRQGASWLRTSSSITTSNSRWAVSIIGVGLVFFFTFRVRSCWKKIVQFCSRSWAPALVLPTDHVAPPANHQPIMIHPHYLFTHLTTRPGGMGVTTAVKRSQDSCNDIQNLYWWQLWIVWEEIHIAFSLSLPYLWLYHGLRFPLCGKCLWSLAGVKSLY